MKSSHPHCPLQQTLQVIGGKWSLVILWHLSQNTLGFNQLQKEIDRISTKVLSEQLKKLERYRLVKRTVMNTNPPRVNYSLTKTGRSLIPVMDTLRTWGETHLPKS